MKAIFCWVAVLYVVAHTRADCATGEYSYLSHCIRVVRTPTLRFANASDTCRNFGSAPFWASLVNVEDATKQAFLEGILSLYSSDFWIDLQYSDMMSEWRMGYQTWDLQRDYTNFDTNRPDGTGDCVFIARGALYKWQDSNCEDRNGYACEYEETSYSGGCPLGFVTYPNSESCYRESGYSDTWENAKSNCSAEGGWLVIIDDDEENQFVDDMMFMHNVWIGLSSHTGSFKWVDGEPVENGFTDWGTGGWGSLDQPDLVGTACTVIYFVDWNDEPCTDLNPFVCEFQGSTSQSTMHMTTINAQTTADVTSRAPTTFATTIQAVTSEVLTTTPPATTMTSTTADFTVETTSELTTMRHGTLSVPTTSFESPTEMPPTTTGPITPKHTIIGSPLSHGSTSSLTTMKEVNGTSQTTARPIWMALTTIVPPTKGETPVEDAIDEAAESDGNSGTFLEMKPEAFIVFSLWLGLSVCLVSVCVIIDCAYFGVKLCHNAKP